MNDKFHKIIVILSGYITKKYCGNLSAVVPLGNGNNGMAIVWSPSDRWKVRGDVLLSPHQVIQDLTDLLKKRDNSSEENFKKEVYEILSGLSDGESDYAYFENLLNDDE